ncbi:MAG: S-layer family protein [Hydrococcus sp. CRU_1_1]|nr:S-layer family protein [Hydrococcus sp. CRU_1_1]
MTIKTDKLSIRDRGQILGDTFGEGNAGSVFIDATDSIELTGRASFISAGVNPGAIGNGGNLEIETRHLTISDIGEINVESLGEGESGDLTIQANLIQLEDGRINATTPLGEGGNITLQVAEDIILQNNSFISAQALDNANGGNVTINANDGVILAFPNQNNDIFANASQGNGGNINISTQAIFGLEERLSTPPNQTNDIDASSEFGLQGDFSLNTPDVDPTSGLLQLPEAVGDASDQISQNPCEKGVGSEFIITGKGGFPSNPNETLNSDEVRVGLVEPLPQPLSYEERGEKRERRGDWETRRRR